MANFTDPCLITQTWKEGNITSVNLTYLASRYKIMVDTSSLMHSKAYSFFAEALPPVLNKYNAKLVLYSSVTQEIDNHIHSNEIHKRRSAQNAEWIVKYLKTLRLIEFVETKYSFADYVILNEIVRLRRFNNIALITQDRDLSNDILNLRDIRSSRYNTDIQTYRLVYSGELIRWKKALS